MTDVPATETPAPKKKVTSRAEAGLVEEGAEIQPQDEAIAEKEWVDLDAVEEAADVPVMTKISGMSEEEQYMDMQPAVVGPPAYGSPNPLTSAGRLLPLNTHPFAKENMPEGAEALIDEAYGQGYDAALTAAELGTQFPGAPQRSDLERDSAGELDERLAEAAGAAPNYDSMTKDELLAEATSRGLNVTASNTKAEITQALVDDDAAKATA